MDNNTNDFYHYAMGIALEQAECAMKLGEVPVGACIFHNTKLISSAHNRREIDKNPLAHAEILAIEKACEYMGGWRLNGCDLFVTLEPCAMCTGAVINSRIGRVIYGAADPKAGCAKSIISLMDLPFNHKAQIINGIRQAECSSILKKFFAQLRKK